VGAKEAMSPEAAMANARTPRRRFFDRKMILLLTAIIALDVILALVGPRETLDLKFYYSGAEARALLAGYDLDTAWSYFVNEFFDLLLIIAYSAALAHGFSKFFARGSPFFALALLPGFLDIAENTGAVYALSTPGPHAYLDAMGTVTALKWLSGLAAPAILIAAARKSIKIKVATTSTLRS
jgi:hypothetical protein